MAAQPRQQQLPRLLIPPSLNAQQPMAFTGHENASLFSPGLPTSIQQGMHPPFPLVQGMHPMQTPMQASFFPHPPGAPNRPTLHRNHPSVAQLAAAGILPPPGMPITPLGQGFPPQMQMFGVPPFPPPFVPRSKRAASVSVGGPPKAVLGGPQRKVSPIPPAAVAAAAAATPAVQKTKKVIVKLPRETVPADGDEPETRPPWARVPLSPSEITEQPDVPFPETTTAEAYPPDSWRYHLPNTVDVFLPGKGAWDAIKHRVIEEKLERLGVERGSGSSIPPHVHAPHARAASISSPADPALLYFKLNKLQQTQNAASANSLSTSPQPPLNLSPSPNQLPPRLQNRHGHSLSLAQPPSFSQSPVYNPAAAFNPFGPSATLGSDQIFNRARPGPTSVPLDTIHAPQGRAPANFSLAPPAPLSRPESGPDFMRGFGLDVTEEEEEPEEEESAAPTDEATDDDGEEMIVGSAQATANSTINVIEDIDMDMDQDGTSTIGQSRAHSRHVSHLSAALSLRSVGGMSGHEMVPSRSPVGEVEVEDLDILEHDQEAVGEWTGSEDLRTPGETSEDESIGEWSNPSDEERARKQRLERRMLRRAKQQDLEVPRRLPNFPRPPETALAYVPVPNDDDIISNPSEEGHVLAQEHFADEFYSRPPSNGATRPLPPLPHSRSGSAQFSHHDPALAHSRSGSEHHVGLNGHARPSSARTESLNPLAKPFVFGAGRQSGSFILGGFGSAPTPPESGSANASESHTRVSSFGRPLNAAAQEFKPTGFTFRPPPGVPQLAFVPPVQTQVPRPLPELPMPVSPSPRVVQGREKRQRHGSDMSFTSDDEDGHNTMSSFKFPPTPETKVRHSAPASPSLSVGHARESSLNASAKPFTFSGFPASVPFAPREPTPLPHPLVAPLAGNEENEPPARVLSPANEDIGSAHELPFPPTSKPRRAPIPLDFKHPVSQNTVPAGLFKQLINDNNEERTRRQVRSRLSSRDIYEHNSPRQSLDDLHVPTISNPLSRNRLFTDPMLRTASPDVEDVFGGERSVRRPSLPPHRRIRSGSSGSSISLPPVNLTRRVEMHQYEQRLEEMLEEKFAEIRETLLDRSVGSGGQALSASTEVMIADLVSLFRTQLQQSAAKDLDESPVDARGELDFELLKGVIEQTHAENRAALQRDLTDLLATRDPDQSLKQAIEEYSNRTMNAFINATQQLANRIQAMENARPLSAAADREAIVRDVVANIMPSINMLRPEPIDYEGLTAQLTQAVKPHISQLIDLASDKQETAGLIVDSLVPIIPTLYPPPAAIDMENIIGTLTTEIRKIVGPLDAHEMKEQVSDLVVERLDSRLAVRDRAFNLDGLTERLVDEIRGLLSPVQELQSAVAALGQKPNGSVAADVDLSTIRDEVVSVISDLPGRLGAATEALTRAQAEFVKATGDDKSASLVAAIGQVQSTITDISSEQTKLVSQNRDFSDFCNDIVKHIDSLPEAMVEATKILQNFHAEFSARDTSQKDAEEIRRLMATNAELQVQMAKARGAHGQVRVEKDILSERLRASEAERERLSARIDESQKSFSDRIANAAATEVKNSELEEALSRALERLKAADVQAQNNAERIAQLESVNRELGSEKQQYKSKIDAVEMRLSFAEREKESMAEELSLLRKQNEELTVQQGHWDELRRASEQMQALTSLMSQNDQEELKELRRIRDRSKTLEGEHTALQRRVKEYESKLGNSEKVAQAAKQSLAQAQQRASEWERRASEYESELERTRAQLDQAEQSQTQLDTEYSLAKLKLDERDAEERLDKDRQNKLRDQIASLEGQVARLQADLDQAKKAAAPLPAPTARRHNGYAHVHPSRPDSRASTIYNESRTGTPTAHYNGAIRVATPPQPSVWDSIHAPTNHATAMRLPMTPKAKHPSGYYRRDIPSPTPSNVSAAPTLGDDGWWQ